MRRGRPQMHSAAEHGLSAPGADCNFAVPETREMPDALYHSNFCRYHPLCRPFLIADRIARPFCLRYVTECILDTLSYYVFSSENVGFCPRRFCLRGFCPDTFLIRYFQQHSLDAARLLSISRLLGQCLVHVVMSYFYWNSML